MSEFQTIYLAHYRRQKAANRKPMTLSQFYDTVFDPIRIPVFVRAK